MGIEGIPAALWRRAETAARWLEAQRREGRTVTVVHHIDADGVTSGAIALECLGRAGIPHDRVAAKSLDDVHIAALQQGGHEALWFCDFGSTAYMHFPDTPKLVCDHHQLVRDGDEEAFAHLNPLLDDVDGDTISGAGCAFLAALAHDAGNEDLLPVALVGAAADLQDRRGGFHGCNASLLAHGAAQGMLEVETDLAWFGTETRDLRKFFAYASEPAVPGVTGDRRSAEAFLMALGVSLQGAGVERTWSMLAAEERQRIRDALVERLIDCGLSDRVSALFRPVVRIAAEPIGAPTRELQGYGTLLNSTARYGEAETGLAVARGDRGAAYRDALDLLGDHRKHLVKSLDAFRHVGVEEHHAIQSVRLGDRVRDTIVGIVCGMALDGLGLRRDMPLIGLADTDDGRIKVSGRAPHEIQGWIDLAIAMRTCAEAFGGAGGGHPGAAGATIPRDAAEPFLDQLDTVIAEQAGRPIPRVPAAGDPAFPTAAWQPPGGGQARLF